MPLIKSAKKKLRQDKKRQKRNKSTKDFLKEVLKKARQNPTVESIRVAVKTTDKAVKKQLIHKNKAARVKSSLSKLISGEAKPTPVKEKKAATKKKKK
ncbi:MAG TPA: 30S ribosomal protein S20 [Candidatus Saccharimonadales bacterium]|nr:30S ribosomal protein S20 [Candidatus Saccharimonadales bacterium]